MHAADNASKAPSKGSESLTGRFFCVTVGEEGSAPTTLTLEASSLVGAILFIQETLPESHVRGAYELLEGVA